jgi:hypothetical protein
MLRANITTSDDAEVDSGLRAGAELSTFAEALVRRSDDPAAARGALLEAVGASGVIDAAGTAANFQRMTRIADAIRIPLDRDDGHARDFRTKMGIDQFAGAENTPAPTL